MHSLARTLSTLALVCSPALAQSTWIVAADGSGDFVHLQPAIDQAADGDTILVRPGNYQGASIDNKSLVLQGQGDAILIPLIAGTPVRILDLAADQTVHVRGFTILAGLGGEQPKILLEDNDGAVLFEDCTLASPITTYNRGVGAQIERSASVTFSRCDLVVDPTFHELSSGESHVYDGVQATDSSVWLYDCLVTGSDGLDAAPGGAPPGASGFAVSLSGSTLVASGCELFGGSGGGAPSGLCFPGEDGSEGLVLAGSAAHPASVAILLDNVVAGGKGGTGGCGLGDGQDAGGTLFVSGTSVNLPGTARRFSCSSPASEGGMIALHAAGEPGDFVLLFVHQEAVAAAFFPILAVSQHVPLPAAVVALGAIPTSGTIDLAILSPVLPPGLLSSRFVGQALFVAPTGVFDGGPSTLLILDGSL